MSSASVSIPPMDALYGERVKTKSQACRFESGRGRHNPLARLRPSGFGRVRVSGARGPTVADAPCRDTAHTYLSSHSSEGA